MSFHFLLHSIAENHRSIHLTEVTKFMLMENVDFETLEEISLAMDPLDGTKVSKELVSSVILIFN